MTISISENLESRAFTVGRNTSGRGPRQTAGSTRVYTVGGTDDQWLIRLALFDGLGQDPANFPVCVAPITDEQGCIRLKLDCQPLGVELWQAKVEYGVGVREADTTSNRDHQPQKSDPIGMESSFDTTGGTVHKTQSIATIGAFKATADTRDFVATANGIGVSERGVAGVDVPAPKFTWTETWKFPAEAVTWGYAIQLSDLTGMYNNAPFRNADAGEVMFFGATGQPDGTDFYRVTYKFQREKNRKGPADPDKPNTGGIVITNGWDPIDKNGWDYLWVAYEQKAGTTYKVLVPRNAFVEQVSYSDDFTKIGIGS